MPFSMFAHAYGTEFWAQRLKRVQKEHYDIVWAEWDYFFVIGFFKSISAYGAFNQVYNQSRVP